MEVIISSTISAAVTLIVCKFENDIWDEYDKYTADLEAKESVE